MYVKNADMVGRIVRLRAHPELGTFRVLRIVAMQSDQLLCGFVIDNGRKRYEVVRRDIALA